MAYNGVLRWKEQGGNLGSSSMMAKAAADVLKDMTKGWSQTLQNEYNRRDNIDQQNTQSTMAANTANYIDQIRSGKTPKLEGLYDLGAITDAKWEKRKYDEAMALKRAAAARAAARAKATQQAASGVAGGRVPGAVTLDMFRPGSKTQQQQQQAVEPKLEEGYLENPNYKEPALSTNISDEKILNSMLDKYGVNDINPYGNLVPNTVAQNTGSVDVPSEGDFVNPMSTLKGQLLGTEEPTPVYDRTGAVESPTYWLKELPLDKQARGERQLPASKQAYNNFVQEDKDMLTRILENQGANPTIEAAKNLPPVQKEAVNTKAKAASSVAKQDLTSNKSTAIKDANSYVKLMTGLLKETTANRDAYKNATNFVDKAYTKWLSDIKSSGMSDKQAKAEAYRANDWRKSQLDALTKSYNANKDTLSTQSNILDYIKEQEKEMSKTQKEQAKAADMATIATALANGQKIDPTSLHTSEGYTKAIDLLKPKKTGSKSSQQKPYKIPESLLDDFSTSEVAQHNLVQEALSKSGLGNLSQAYDAFIDGYGQQISLSNPFSYPALVTDAPDDKSDAIQRLNEFLDKAGITGEKKRKALRELNKLYK